MQRKITKIRFRFDDSPNTFITFDKKTWLIYDSMNEQSLVHHRIWRITIKRSKTDKVKKLIKALYNCPYKKEVNLERDGYTIYFAR